jgi:hypothetical protein
MGEWRMTPARRAQVDAHRGSMDDALVPRELRLEGIACANRRLEGDRRYEALIWLKSRHRTRSDVEAFIARLEPEA